MAHMVTCEACHTDLPAWQAVIRSVSLEQRAWHKGCFGRVVPFKAPMGELGRRLREKMAS